MQTDPRQHEAAARQCLADMLASDGLHDHAGPDRRELVLNDLVERALLAYEGFRRCEDETRRAWAGGTDPYDPAVHAGLGRTARLHLEIGRSLVSQLDGAARDRLTVRNALPFRQAYASLVALEVLDHGLLPPALLSLAGAALAEFDAGDAQPIDPEDERNRVDSFRTWDFMKRTAALDNAIQDLAAKRYRNFFAVDDRHPALGGRPVLGGRRLELAGPAHLWSVEISFDHRAFAVLPERDEKARTCYVWFWIGSPVDYLAFTA